MRPPEDDIDWTEHTPEALGMDQAGLSRVVGLVEARGAKAQLCVLRDGAVVLDRAFGCEPTSLFWIFSAGKPYTAMLVHLLSQRGRLSLDAPVATYWPEFGRHGKDRITIRHVLQHRSGLPSGGTLFGDLLAMTDWRRSVRRIQNARPRWPAGQVPAYQPLAYGFVLGELVRRVTGSPIERLLALELLAPLRSGDTYLGLPDAEWPRHVPIRAGGPAGVGVETVLNRRSTRRAVIPAAGVSTTARDLAAFYLMLLRGGSADGVRLLEPATVELARTPTSEGEIDRTVKVPIRWSHGFQLGGPRPGWPAPGPMGARASRRTFGHNGSGCCIAWADPERGLVVAYLTNRLTTRSADVRHQTNVADALLAACDGTTRRAVAGPG
ncbi:serine hydrolase domain-containing protein [Microbispora sp. NPDC049125]|uniref:serine hydrolase domain-containing protein n=1 Tax=Microbispora sp. NPDC049125 TaxID=3154929 RepID=UPI003467B1B0